VKLRVKTEKKYKKKRKTENIFQNSKWKQEHAIELNNRFKILENIKIMIILTIILMENGKTLKQ
jgi:hypothetical protein